MANDGLAEALGVPEDYIRRIPDSISPLLLAEALADLWEAGRSPGAARAREAERRAYSEKRSLRRYALQLCRALSIEAGEARIAA